MIKFKTTKTATITCNSCGFGLIIDWKTMRQVDDALKFHEWHGLGNGAYLCPDCWDEAEGVE